jgi:hypothetical protein
MADQSPPSEPPKATPSPLSPSGYSNHAIHLVRTVQAMNLTLSQMADSKASILMAATFVVFTITMGQAKNGRLPASLLVLAAFAFASAMCAVIAVLPSIGRPSKGSGPPMSPNRLFFGTFTAMDEEEWTQSVLADLKSDEGTFRLMLHDMYQNGQVLQNKKYRYLGYAYRLFMAGLCATVAVFIAEYVMARGG